MAKVCSRCQTSQSAKRNDPFRFIPKKPRLQTFLKKELLFTTSAPENNSSFSINSSSSTSVSQRLKKNQKINIDATLDLHGEILQNAYVILVRFIEKALFWKNRVILVITGKSLGKISHHRPRLIEMVPLWLQRPPLNQYIKKVTYAKREHGGEGAFYIFLKNL